MLDGLCAESVRLVPGARLLVQFFLLGRRHAAAKVIGKQLMVTVPLSFIVETDQKHVGLIQIREDVLAVNPPGNRVAQWCAQALENCRSMQKGTNVIGLPFQNLVRQILDQITMPPAECCCGLSRFAQGLLTTAEPERKCGHLQPRDPAFGSSLERSRRSGVDVEPHSLTKKKYRFVVREA